MHDEVRDAESHALTERSRAARTHAANVARYEADLDLVRSHPAVTPETETVIAGCLTSTVAARERVLHLATLLEAFDRLHRGCASRADRELLATEARRARDDATAEDDAIRGLLADAARALRPRESHRSERRLADASPAELTIFGDLLERGLTFDQLVQLLDGAHLLVPGRSLLVRWGALDGATPRVSSHYHGALEPDAGPQYGLAGRFTREVLFGPAPHDSTFVQLERAAPSAAHLPRHLANWAEYRATHRNQGPYGSSAFTDADPLELLRAGIDLGVLPGPALAARVRVIARELHATGSVLEPELSLTALVCTVPAADTYDAALAAAVDAYGRAGESAGAVASALAPGASGSGPKPPAE